MQVSDNQLDVWVEVITQGSDKLQALVAVRRELQPSIKGGSAACDGRLRYLLAVKRLISACLDYLSNDVTLILTCHKTQSCRAYSIYRSGDRGYGIMARFCDCRDVIFLDMALASSACSVVEGKIGALNGLAAGAEGTKELLKATSLTLETAVLSFAGDVELALCLQEFKVIFVYMLKFNLAAARG